MRKHFLFSLVLPLLPWLTSAHAGVITAPIVKSGVYAPLPTTLSTSEASLRFAEFFAAPWPNIASLQSALASLSDPAVTRIYTEAVVRLLKTPANTTEPRRELKLAILLRFPELQAALPEDLRIAVAAEQEKIDEQRWNAMSSEIDAVVKNWEGKDAMMAGMVQAPNESAHTTALVLKSHLDTQLVGRPVATGLRSRIFAVLPSRARSSLARRSEGLRATQINALLGEISTLLPGESFAAMAYLPQTSHDYIVQDMLPKVPEASERAAREIARHPEWPSYMVSSARPDADKQAWFERLADAKAKLEELASLQRPDDPTQERAMVQLGLGVLHSFSYGFASGLKHRHHDAGHDSMSGGSRDYIDRATAHLQNALVLFETTGQDNAALLARFLLGKHAINGRHAYSNPGLYEWSGSKVPREPQAFDYEALAKRMLNSVTSTLGATAASAQGGVREIYFETLYFLEELDYIARAPDLNPYRERGQRVDPARRAQALSTLLTDYLIGAPADRIEAQLASGNRYTLVERLLSRLRWALQESGDTRLRDALFDERYKGQPLTYNRLIGMLIDNAGCEQLRPLRDALPRPVKVLEQNATPL